MPTALTAAWSMVSSMTLEVVMAMLSTRYSEGFRFSRTLVSMFRICTSSRGMWKGRNSPMCPRMSRAPGKSSKTPPTMTRGACPAVSAARLYSGPTSSGRSRVISQSPAGRGWGVRVQGRAQFLKGRPHRPEPWRVQVPPAGVTVDQEPGHAEVAHGPPGLAYRGLGVLEREAGQHHRFLDGDDPQPPLSPARSAVGRGGAGAQQRGRAAEGHPRTRRGVGNRPVRVTQLRK